MLYYDTLDGMDGREDFAVIVALSLMPDVVTAVEDANVLVLQLQPYLHFGRVAALRTVRHRDSTRTQWDRLQLLG